MCLDLEPAGLLLLPGVLCLSELCRDPVRHGADGVILLSVDWWSCVGKRHGRVDQDKYGVPQAVHTGYCEHLSPSHLCRGRVQGEHLLRT